MNVSIYYSCRTSPASDVSKNLGIPFLYGAYSPGNGFQLSLTVKMETRHPIEGSFGSEFPAVCNHCAVTAAGSRKTLKNFPEIFVFFDKMSLYGKIFKILFQKFSPPHQSTCCVQIS